MSATRGARWLAARGIPFRLVRYEHAVKGAACAARATGVPLAEVVKTLVVEAEGEGCLLALVPGDRELDLRRLALALGVKRARLADPSDAERVTGYRVGGISPFGTRRALAVVVEAAILTRERILVNAGGRGVMLAMAPAGLLELPGVRVLEIAPLPAAPSP